MNQIKSKAQIKQRKRTHRIWTALALCVMALTMGACGKDGQGDGGSAQGTRQSSGAGQQNNVEHSLDALQSSGSRKEEGQAALPEAPASDFEYKEEDGKIVLKSYTGSATEIVIPSAIDGKDVVAIGKQCFRNKSKITKLVCPGTLIEIREEAFLNCGGLSEIILNEGLQQIGEKAFLTCTSLEKIDFPESLTSIGDLSFGLSGLTEITIPATLDELAEGCFCATDITAITIPSNIKALRKGALSDCPNLEKVIIEEGLEIIEEDVFRGCTALKEVNIPASVNEMDESVFWASNDVVVTVFPGSIAEERVKAEGVQFKFYE